MPEGFLALVLHAHLPFVRHPEHEFFLEEKWYYEAVTECYIPLIHVMERLIRDGVDFRLTMSLTPPLLAMFRDELLQERCSRYINSLCELAEREEDRTRYEPHFHHVAQMYRNLFHHVRHTFEDRYARNLINAFKWLQDTGKLEIITCAATHGFLPLLNHNEESIYGQIEVAVQDYERQFGQIPKGIWLPECGFYPGLDRILEQYGLKYFFVDTHGIMNAEYRPKYGPYAPVYCPSGVAAFGRDVETSKQVWSANEGYPGDFDYREFYRDIGYDLPLDYVGPYLHPRNLRGHTGIKYHRITGNTNHKEPYNPHQAWEKAAQHAGNFMFNREKQVEFLASIFDRQPIIVSPYDCELFGHWWFEGPHWLELLMRKMAFDQDTVKLITPSEYLKLYPVNQMTMPSMSSWGYKGYNEVWLGGSNDWIYRHLYKAAERMREMANRYECPDFRERRALNQAARELLLAQSSDWAFIMKTGTMVPYAVKRTQDHLARFNKIYEDIKNNTIEEWWLADVERKDNIFLEIDYRVFRSRSAIPAATQA